MTKKTNVGLGDIVEEFGVGKVPERVSTIPLEKLKCWMESRDIEVLGAVASFISDARYFTRIKPPIRFDDTHTFLLRYFKRCLLENPDGEWADSRYSAGRDVYLWFVSLWNKKNTRSVVFDDYKALLASLYRTGDAELRTCIVTATLEHLFETSSIRKFFADWKEDPILKQAYDEAAEWTSGLKITTKIKQFRSRGALSTGKTEAEDAGSRTAKTLRGYAQHLKEIGQHTPAKEIEQNIKKLRPRSNNKGR